MFYHHYLFPNSLHRYYLLGADVFFLSFFLFLIIKPRKIMLVLMQIISKHWTKYHLGLLGFLPPRRSQCTVYACGKDRDLNAAAAAKSLQSCPTLCDPIDGSLPGSSVRGIFQARVLEWGAIAFCRDLNIYNSKGRLCLSLWPFTDVECSHSRHMVGLTCLLFQVRFCLVACLAHKT